MESFKLCEEALIAADRGRGIQFKASSIEAQDFVQAINRLMLHGLKLDVEVKGKAIDLFLVIKLMDKPLPPPVASLPASLDHFEKERAWIRQKLNDGTLSNVLSIFAKESPAFLYYPWGFLMCKPLVEAFLEQLKRVVDYNFCFDVIEDPIGFVVQRSLKFYVHSFPSSYNTAANVDMADTKIISTNSQRMSLKAHTYVSPLSAIGTGTSVIKVEKSKKKRRPKTAVIIEDPDAVVEEDDGYAKKRNAKHPKAKQVKNTEKEHHEESTTTIAEKKRNSAKAYVDIGPAQNTPQEPFPRTKSPTTTTTIVEQVHQPRNLSDEDKIKPEEKQPEIVKAESKESEPATPFEEQKAQESTLASAGEANEAKQEKHYESTNPFEDDEEPQKVEPAKEDEKVVSSAENRDEKKANESTNPFESDELSKPRKSINPFDDDNTPKPQESEQTKVEETKKEVPKSLNEPTNPFGDDLESSKPQEESTNPFEMDEEPPKIEAVKEDEKASTLAEKIEVHEPTNPFEDDDDEDEPQKPQEQTTKPFEGDTKKEEPVNDNHKIVPTAVVATTTEIAQSPSKSEDEENEVQPKKPTATATATAPDIVLESKPAEHQQANHTKTPTLSQSPQELELKLKSTESSLRMRFEELKRKTVVLNEGLSGKGDNTTEEEKEEKDAKAKSTPPESSPETASALKAAHNSNSCDDDDAEDDSCMASVFTMSVKESTVIEDYVGEDKKKTLYQIAQERQDKMRRDQIEQKWSTAPQGWVPVYDKLNFYLFNKPEYRVKKGKTCYKCGKKSSGVLFDGLRFCEYTGKYMCASCINGRKFYIPGRMVHEWDFNEYPINNTSYEYLNKIFKDPVISITKCNPYLYRKASELEELRILRKKLFYIREIIMACTNDDSGSTIHCKQLFRSLKEYYYKDLDTYSLWDLANHESLADTLKLTYSESVKHISSCKVCISKGSTCKICNSKKPMFLFQFQTVAACKNCSNLYHISCLSRASCPVCTGGNNTN